MWSLLYISRTLSVYATESLAKFDTEFMINIIQFFNLFISKQIVYVTNYNTKNFRIGLSFIIS